MNNKNNDYYFLQGGGEMGRLIREKDWSSTSLGSPENWEQSFRTIVAMMLENPFAMYIVWGKDYIQLYNDGYRPILGTRKHPQALGTSSHDTFAEIWPIIGPMFNDAFKGKSFDLHDFMLTINRYGFNESCYFDFSYSPIRKDNGEVGGVLVTVIETTNKKNAEELLKESEERFRTIADNIPNLAWMADAKGWIYWYNKKWYEYTGTTQMQMEGWGWQSVHDPVYLPLVMAKWQESLATSKPFEMVFPLRGSDGKYRHFLTRVLPVKDTEGEVSQWFGSNTDITLQIEAEQDLQESQKRFHDTVKQAPVGITILRGSNYFVEMANDAYLTLVDRTEEEFVGKPLFDAIPEVKESVQPLIDKVLKTGIPFHGNEYPIPIVRNKKKDVFYFDFLYHPLREKNGEISGVIVTVTDVSAQVISRLKVEESEQRFRQVADSAPVLIWMSKTDKLNFFYNKGWLNFTGRTLEEEYGNGWTKGVHPDDLQRFLDVYTLNFDQQKPFYIEYRLKRHDGEYRWISDNGAPRFTAYGEFEGYIGACMDITNDRQHQKELIASEQKFRLLANSMPQHIWTSDIDGKLNYFNQSILDYSGLTSDQLQKDGWLKIAHPSETEENIKLWTHSITTGEDFLFEHRFLHHSGEYRWQLSRAIPQKDKNGKIQMWVGTSTDIQDQKVFTNELETQVLQRTGELNQNNLKLERMNSELQSFAYISSHDLQEPLRKIQLFTNQIMEMEFENLSEKGKYKFGRMENAAKRMQTLIQDLLTYSRTQNQERKFEKTKLNIIVEEVKEDLKEEIQQKKALIKMNASCTITIIPFQFRQLIYNLISNSLKFSVEERLPIIKIKCNMVKKISLKHLDGLTGKVYCHISVSDNGIGFESLYNEKIFEVFQRLHAKNQYDGTGIGLAIVKKIVENHSGIITAKGKPNKGATFDIYIPAD